MIINLLSRDDGDGCLRGDDGGGSLGVCDEGGIYILLAPRPFSFACHLPHSTPADAAPGLQAAAAGPIAFDE